MKVKSTLLYGASGSFEEVTIKKWKRLRVLAHKSPGNVKLLSPIVRGAQIAAGLLANQYRISPAFIDKGFQEYKAKLPPYSQWVKEMYTSNNIYVDYDYAALDMDNAPLAKGTMLNPESYLPTSYSRGTGLLRLTWNNSVRYSQLASDRLNVLIWISSKGLWYYKGDVAARSAGTVDMFVPTAALTGFTVAQAFLFFTGAAGTATFGKNDNALMRGWVLI